MSIPEFISRCDTFCRQTGVSRSWLSKRLLHDTSRLKLLAQGRADIGVRRLERAMADLAELERTHERVAA